MGHEPGARCAVLRYIPEGYSCLISRARRNCESGRNTSTDWTRSKTLFCPSETDTETETESVTLVTNTLLLLCCCWAVCALRVPTSLYALYKWYVLTVTGPRELAHCKYP